jgi:alpha-glucosidase (family GH31 glycosyl hydrolase)
VAPIFSEENSRRVYLPAGDWTDWWTKTRMAGRRWVDVDADIETLPLFIREGGLIPMGPVMNHVDEFPVKKISLVVSLFGNDGESMLPIAVNDEHVPVEYKAKDGKHALSICKTEVEFEIETLGDGELKVVRQ